MEHQPFSYDSEAAFLEDIASKGLAIPYQQDTSVLCTPYTGMNLTIKNRILSQPIEGFDSKSNGAPSERSASRYCRLAKNGFGTLWFESISVSEDGRSNPYQLWLTEENSTEFKSMLHRVRDSGNGAPPFLVAQLTHSGRYSKPTPVCGFENPLIPKENAVIASDDYLEKLEDTYVKTALLAEYVGFDAVDIRACHGYLINELFAAYNRSGQYGGCFENRIRLLVNIVKKLRKVSNIPIGVRLNMFDAMPYPFGWGCSKNNPLVPDLAEPLNLLDILASLGVKIFNISSGIGAISPYVIRPYDRGGIPCPEHPLEGVYRMLDMARQVKAAHPDILVAGSALSWLREFAPGVASSCIQNGWFDLAGFGRQCIAYPEFAKEILSGHTMDRSACCTTCCGCTALIKKRQKKLRCVYRTEDQDY